MKFYLLAPKTSGMIIVLLLRVKEPGLGLTKVGQQ
jgi:hypothetical protein